MEVNRLGREPQGLRFREDESSEVYAKDPFPAPASAAPSELNSIFYPLPGAHAPGYLLRPLRGNLTVMQYVFSYESLSGLARLRNGKNQSVFL